MARKTRHEMPPSRTKVERITRATKSRSCITRSVEVAIMVTTKSSTAKAPAEPSQQLVVKIINCRAREIAMVARTQL
jgi:hypothetical protein